MVVLQVRSRYQQFEKEGAKADALQGPDQIPASQTRLHRQDQNESAAILKIKESMQEEAKRFEKEPGDHPDFTYMQ